MQKSLKLILSIYVLLLTSSCGAIAGNSLDDSFVSIDEDPWVAIDDSKSQIPY